MTLNRRQPRVVYGALIAVALSALIPPWTRIVTLFDVGESHSVQQVRQTSRYAPIWQPPKSSGDAYGATTYVVDWQRLALSWVFIGGIAGVLVVLLADKKAT
jgi:hypothetical protein